MAPIIIIISICLFLLLTFSSTTACDRCVHQSKLSSVLQSAGACGYGSMAVSFNGGHIAAAGVKIYKDGARCGACYQIRCKNPNFCTNHGTIVMVTDLVTSTNETDFVVSTGTLRAMANMGNDQNILQLVNTNLDVEYKRVACEHGSNNLAIRVEESSQRPSHLAVTFLNQGGQTEIIAVDVAPVGFPNWSFMRRSTRGGAIWETSAAPSGPLQFRLVVTAGFDGKWYWASNALPADWETGMIYDSGIQITDIAQETDCSPCDDGTW
ncbi:expansin-like A1 [Ipomoea triloba]|uniref:expansin-like A1 n=1 Tax=Ipomoea triloba TaxID=35885 RepID=UPI00125D18C8|nr:expansin-like A1 [Ipomoea triloba]